MFPHPTWEVDFYIQGPISIGDLMNFNEPKGYELDNPFYSTIELRPAAIGFRATVTAYASTSDLAYKAGFLFFGHMLDALSLHIHQPLYLSYDGRLPSTRDRSSPRRRVSHDEFTNAFREARLLAFSEPTFLRSLGWFRKGLYSQDPFDSFLAFWNSIEIVSNKFHPPIPEGRPEGSKSNIWESFKSIWGECEDWPHIGGDNEWIDRNNDIRNRIAHGAAPIIIDEVEQVLSEIHKIRKVAHHFLTDWRTGELDPQIPENMQDRYGY